MKETDFIAELIYLSTDQGGRLTPALSGYRPQVKFDFSDMQTSGQQTFLNKDIVYPGEIISAEIALISPQFFRGKLYVGLDFEFREGARIIGNGRIIKIVNKDFEISNE
jgi:translation elongation factor EF-Tu-like GTPase